MVTILDCCYSGAAILGAKGENEGSKIITDVFDKQHSEGAGRCLLAASQQYEEAYTLVDQNHSIFTHYLLKGLRGDKNSVDYNGNVTAFTLGSYVFNTISSLDSKKRPKQKPVIKADTSGDIVLAEYPDLAKVIQEERSAQELEEFVDKKDFKNGFDYVEKLIKKYSDNSELWNYRGICCCNLKYYEMAIKSFEIGLMGDPTNSILRINCCLAYKDRAYTHGIKAEFEEALEYFEKSVSYLPNEKLLWNVKGELLAKLGIYEEALQSYEKALQIDPTYVDTWNNKGLILQNMRRYYDAIYCYDKVLKLNPSDETAWNNKGLISHDLENYKEAINCFDRVLVLNPYVKYVLLNKAETLHELGDYTGEEKCRERARKI
ncbi:MAG: tetratricopeptide repeat protein [Nitrososphaeraceae archaeon]